MIRSLIIVLASILAAPAIAKQPCFDLAIIGKSPTYKILRDDRPVDDNEIVLSRPARISFTVERTLIGTYRRQIIQIEGYFHNDYNPSIRHFLLLLKKKSNGKFEEIDMNTHIVRLASGDYAMPVERPFDTEWLQPDGYIAADYQDRMTQLRYAPSEAWWLDDISADEQERLATDFPWTTVSRNRVTAPRGLEARALIEMMRPLRCQQQ